MAVISNVTTCPCKKFDLKSSFKALDWQQSKLGKYDHVPFLVAGKDLFYNIHQRQYLFWVDNTPGYWMVIKFLVLIKVSHQNIIRHR